MRHRLQSDRSKMIAILIIFILLHVYRCVSPPNGYHQWRESDTAAVTLNYYQEDMSFLEPRINQRGVTSGVTGMELPIYNYLGAILYSLFGYSHFWLHLITIFAAAAALWLLYEVALVILGAGAAIMAAWAMAFSPLFLFYSFKMMPDILMLSLLLAGVLFFLRFINRQRHLYWLLSAICLSASACIKPLGLSVFLPLAGLLWSRGEFSRRNMAMFSGFFVLVSLPVAVWLSYAQWLQSISGLHQFYLGGNLSSFYQHFLTLTFVKKLVLQWPYELWIGWALLIPFGVGAWRLFRERRGLFLLLWIVGSYICLCLNRI